MDLPKASSAIKGAFICGIISTALTLIATLVAISKGSMTVTGIQFSIFTFLDVAVLGGLTVGLYFKSRTCAVLMLAYFIWCKYLQLAGGAAASTLVVGAVFLFFFFQGLRGTFAYHRIKKEAANQSPEPPALSDRG